MTNTHPAPPARSRLRRWLDRLILNHVWYVHKPVVFMIRATPGQCVQTIATAAKPSVSRLHHRNLFAQGRRYFLRPVQDGFRLTTTSTLRWRYRRRTSSTTVMNGTFSPFGEDITRIHLRVRINIGYLLDTFLIPVFMTSILVYVPWQPKVIVASLFVLYALSWMGHRYNAALEAHEMIWFVQKALDDLVPAEVATLASQVDNTVYMSEEFEREWQRFYEQHKDER